MATVPGEGTTLKVTITATPTVIGAVISVDPPELARPPIDTSHLTSNPREYRVGVLDISELTFVINYDPGTTTHAYLTSSILAGTLEVWLLTFADSGTATYGFSGYLSSFKPESIELDGNVTATVKIRPTTTITITP